MKYSILGIKRGEVIYEVMCRDRIYFSVCCRCRPASPLSITGLSGLNDSDFQDEDSGLEDGGDEGRE